MANKICVWPSSEINSVYGLIGRQAAYLVCERTRPDKTVIGCMPALFAGVDEDIDFAVNYPVITLEGHPAHNASKLLKEYARNHLKTIVVDVRSFLKNKRINVSDSSEQRLGPKGRKAAAALAKHTTKLVDELLRGR